MFQCEKIWHRVLSGIIILLVNSKADIINRKLVCRLIFPAAYCYATINKLPENEVPRIPLETIPRPQKVQTIWIDLETPYEAGCTIDDHTMFHRFTEVFQITVIGPVNISTRYNKQENRATLINELFNLKNLKIVRLENWKLGDNFTWKFPNDIEGLDLIRHEYTQIDLSSYPKLISLQLDGNKLKTMPRLSDPPPPLRILDLSNNPGIGIAVHDIVGLCYLGVLPLDGDFSKTFNDTDDDCVCKILKNYMVEFRIFGSRHLYCYSQTDCSSYKYEEMILRHREKCYNVTDKIVRIPGIEGFLNNKMFWILLILTIVCLYAIMMTGYVFYDIYGHLLHIF